MRILLLSLGFGLILGLSAEATKVAADTTCADISDVYTSKITSCAGNPMDTSVNKYKNNGDTGATVCIAVTNQSPNVTGLTILNPSCYTTTTTSDATRTTGNLTVQSNRNNTCATASYHTVATNSGTQCTATTDETMSFTVLCDC